MELIIVRQFATIKIRDDDRDPSAFRGIPSFRELISSRVERILRLSFFRITINLLKHRFRPSKNTFKYLLMYEKRLLHFTYRN